MSTYREIPASSALSETLRPPAKSRAAIQYLNSRSSLVIRTSACSLDSHVNIDA